MPEPLRLSQRYLPGLDGLRALAVLAVIAYHLEFGWAQGGLLGVGIFFTLSGYLITDLLLAQMRRGGMRLAQFWLGRARRLLPALFLMLAVVVIWVATAGPAQPAEFREAVAAAALYVSNWQLIFQHISYFARFGPPSPLSHLWTLGVEEQFYILWPLLLALGVKLVRERPSASGLRVRLAGLTLLLAAGSAVEMALLYRPGFDPSRVYYGTDTRAFGLLAGAALAMVWPSARLRPGIARGARLTLDWLGVAGLIAILALIAQTSQYSPFLYRGGFVLLALAGVLVIAALAHPACRLGRALGIAPLRWIGVRSYGIYLWSLPVIALTTPARAHGVDPVRDALQVAATIGLAALSWRLVEQPVRHGALGRMWRRLQSARWRPLAVGRLDGAIVAGSACLLALAGVGLASSRIGGRLASASGGLASASASVSRSYSAASHDPSGADGGDPSSERSSCRAVVHIGDSTSEGLISSNYLPNPSMRIEAQYARVGAAVQHFEISGARSIVETYDRQPNAYHVAQRWKRAGYHGCWVLALGTNDTADVFVGSNVGRLARIQQMMSAIGDEPVMWVDVKSLLAGGPYSEHNMRLWNDALMQACRLYPNLHVFDWAALARDSWFIDDGIHYNTPGYAQRSRLIAQGLSRAFPAAQVEPPCVVR
jgi:peptidoglycan/LPS O-acetylase OafA/YrhL